MKTPPFLLGFSHDTLRTDILPLNKPLIIPLGKAVESVLEQFIKEGSISESQCLMGFPHPSGANGHRQKNSTN
jgi:hypothetical protein